jgi:hypothetical protein
MLRISAFTVAVALACATGCHLGHGAKGGCNGCGVTGCGPAGCGNEPGCGLLGCGPGGGGPGGFDYGTTPEELKYDGYGSRGGQVGVLAGLHGRHHRGPQSHMGPYPGPADGPPAPTVTYPYYTTRGPRDFLLANPPPLGR